MQQPVTARPQPVPAEARTNGAIFQVASYHPLFEDRRPRNVGDTLDDQHQRENPGEQAGILKWFQDGRGRFIDQRGCVGLPLKMLQGLGVIADSSNEFDDAAKVNSGNTFSGNITVTVIEVLPNGNLVVAGEKQIALDKGTEYIRLSGVVQPDTILAGNNVSSSRVADARIEYRTSTKFDKAEMMNWMGRFFLSFIPF